MRTVTGLRKTRKKLMQGSLKRCRYRVCDSLTVYVTCPWQRRCSYSHIVCPYPWAMALSASGSETSLSGTLIAIGILGGWILPESGTTIRPPAYVPSLRSSAAAASRVSGSANNSSKAEPAVVINIIGEWEVEDLRAPLGECAASSQKHQHACDRRDPDQSNRLAFHLYALGQDTGDQCRSQRRV
jgi:hypothetical protein